MATTLVNWAAFCADGWQWRINKIQDGRLFLSYSEVEDTDDVSSLKFYCRPASGVIEVFNNADKKARQVFSDLIRTNSYPKVEFENEISTPVVSHSDVVGWEYHFEIAADGDAFNQFKRTGQMKFKIGSLVANNKTPAGGLRKISEF